MKIKICVTALSLLWMTGCATTPQFFASKPQDMTPLQQIIKAHPQLPEQQHNLSIRQVFNRAEAPTAAKVVVLEQGLLDDSVSSIRSTYQFKRQEEKWKLITEKKEYMCRRGENTKSFQTAVCA